MYALTGSCRYVGIVVGRGVRIFSSGTVAHGGRLRCEALPRGIRISILTDLPKLDSEGSRVPNSTVTSTQQWQVESPTSSSHYSDLNQIHESKRQRVVHIDENCKDSITTRFLSGATRRYAHDARIRNSLSSLSIARSSNIV